MALDHLPPAWIIEELRRRREELDEVARMPVELPIPPPPAPDRAREEAPHRTPGCIVIDLWG